MEQYRSIQGYEGLYEVSNEGRVKSLNYKHTGEERVLKPATDGRGYLFVHLCKNGKIKHYSIHRLVASAFIPNHDNKPEVNHKDECKTNNCVFVNPDGSIDEEKSNLEWCTSKYNANYGTRNERVGEANKGLFINRVDLSISVDMLTKNGEFIRQFPSAMEAERWLRANGYPRASQASITKCCQGKQWYKSCYGFKWMYAKGN